MVPGVGAAACLTGPEYFDCIRLRCRLTQRACVARQKLQERAAWARHIRTGAASERAENMNLDCLGCAQGIRNKEEVGMGKAKEKAVKRPRPRAACVNCNRVLAIIGNGLCGGCYTAVRKRPSGQSEEQALKEARSRFGPEGFSPEETWNESRSVTLPAAILGLPNPIRLPEPDCFFAKKGTRSVYSHTNLARYLAHKLAPLRVDEGVFWSYDACAGVWKKYPELEVRKLAFDSLDTFANDGRVSLAMGALRLLLAREAEQAGAGSPGPGTSGGGIGAGGRVTVVKPAPSLQVEFPPDPEKKPEPDPERPERSKKRGGISVRIIEGDPRVAELARNLENVAKRAEEGLRKLAELAELVAKKKKSPEEIGLVADVMVATSRSIDNEAAIGVMEKRLAEVEMITQQIAASDIYPGAKEYDGLRARLSDLEKAGHSGDGRVALSDVKPQLFVPWEKVLRVVEESLTLEEDYPGGDDTKKKVEALLRRISQGLIYNLAHYIEGSIGVVKW